jgi:hypothetical protein
MPVTIRTATAPPSSGVPGEVDTLFVAAKITAAGLPTSEATSVRSMADYVAAGGDRADNAVTYDGLDLFFREGGTQAYVAVYNGTSTTFADALAQFTEDLGGGQVVAWDEVAGAATYGALQDYAAGGSMRYAYLDVAVGDDTESKLAAKAALMPESNNEYGALFGPWITIPAPAGVIGGTERQAPASAAAAALTARADALGNPNRAPAGRDFPLQYAIGFVGAQLTDADATALRSAGLNPFRKKFGLLVLDGFQTSVDQTPDSPFWQANCGRARMWMQWRAKAIGLNYEYKPIDGRGRLARALQTDLDAMCLELYGVDGLYGDTPAEAFNTEVGVSVNTTDTIAQGELHAVTEARFSLHAKSVIIDLVSVPITGRVSAAA